jgi:hypothetical protein
MKKRRTKKDAAREEAREREANYQREYYAEHKKKIRARCHEQWRNDPLWRAGEQERARRRRGELRAQRAADRFAAMVLDKQLNEPVTRPPRFIMLRGAPVQVWTSGSLGREVGRSPRAIRGWLREGVLPGATAYIGEAAFFAHDFCSAVWRACKRIYYLDGRGDKQVLKRIIREELAAGRVIYVPPNGDNERDRLVASAVAVG